MAFWEHSNPDVGKGTYGAKEQTFLVKLWRPKLRQNLVAPMGSAHMLTWILGMIKAR
jgi:hypothetical protein